MKDLIERLRIVAKYHRTDRQASDDAVILEAADAIERLSVASNEEFPALVLSVALSATDMQVIHTYLGAHAIQAQAPLKAENTQLRSNHERLKKMVDDGSINDRTYSAGIEQERVIEKLEAENAQLKAELASREWQPIETAPKDMFSRLYRVRGYCVQGFVDAAGILQSQNDRYEWQKMVAAPTHWMPLPTPPGAKP